MMNRGAVALPPHLQHLFIQADRNRKVDVLRRAVHAMDVQRCLIFVNFGRRSKDVEGKLSARGMPVASLHGDMDKIQRERVLKKFKSGEVRALLVSDLAARGLDIPNCDCVINLELPTDEVHYVHRAGRTGRMGAPGVVVSICEQRENFVVDKFAQKLGIEIVGASPERGRMNVKGDKATF
jgi:superfamily II DNA/RNA helicase